MTILNFLHIIFLTTGAAIKGKKMNELFFECASFTILHNDVFFARKTLSIKLLFYMVCINILFKYCMD